MATQQKFGVGLLIATTTRDSLGNALALPKPYRLGILQDVSTDFSYEGKPLYGSNMLPVDRGRGKAKLAFSAKTADIKIAALAALHWGVTPTAGFKGLAPDVPGTIPAVSTYTVTPAVPSSGTWLADQGVSDTSGNSFSRVASAPSAGEYTVAAGTYTFASADASKAMLFTFEYSSPGAGIVVPLTNQLMGYSPSFQVLLYNDTKGSKLALKLTNCQSDKLAIPLKNEDFAVADFSWEALDDGTGSAGYWSQA